MSWIRKEFNNVSCVVNDKRMSKTFWIAASFTSFKNKKSEIGTWKSHLRWQDMEHDARLWCRLNLIWSHRQALQPWAALLWTSGTASPLAQPAQSISTSYQFISAHSPNSVLRTHHKSALASASEGPKFHVPGLLKPWYLLRCHLMNHLAHL